MISSRTPSTDWLTNGHFWTVLRNLDAFEPVRTGRRLKSRHYCGSCPRHIPCDSSVETEKVMQIICAWCRREGRPGLLGQKAPLDDPSETHSVCERHRRRELEGLQAKSFPGIRLLVVVAPREQRLYEHLTRVLAGLEDVSVIMERRQGERRRPAANPTQERRRRERRLRRGYAPATWYRYVRFGRAAEG